jgi:hypothetical protein
MLTRHFQAMTSYFSAASMLSTFSKNPLKLSTDGDVHFIQTGGRKWVASTRALSVSPENTITSLNGVKIIWFSFSSFGNVGDLQLPMRV